MVGLLEVFIFVCIFSYFIGKNRTGIMIDILTTRFNDAYSYLVSEGVNSQMVNNNDLIKDKTSISRFNNEHMRYSKSTMILKDTEQLSNGHADTVRDDASSLLQIDGLTCQDCTKDSNLQSQINPTDRAQAAVDILKVTQHAPGKNKYDWGTYFPHIAQNLRVKKYKYKPIFDSVLNHKRVQHEIERVARSEVRESDVSFEMEDIYYEKLLDNYKKRAFKLLYDMRHTLSDGLLRLTSYVLYKLLPWFLSGVVAHPAQIEMLKVAQKKLPNTPLVFLPLHRSHLDYILVTFILLNNDIRCPQVCAGDNLNIPVFGFLLRGLGAFYIKRKIDTVDGKKDYIYRGLLQTYMEESISAGHNIEFFIEGGRTRTGKPGLPKGGILSVIVDAFVDGLIDDALLVPVSVNYEKLVDGSFVREQLGIPKKKESFRKAIASIFKVLNAKYGLMRIDFNEPYSLRELVKSFKERKTSVPRPLPAFRRLISKPSMASMYGDMDIADKHRALVDNIGRHVVYDSCTAMSIMSTNAVAFLMLNKYRNGTTLKELAGALDAMRKQFEGKRDFGFDAPSETVIMTAVELLGTEMITRRVDPNGDIFIAPVVSLPNVVETFYYSQTFAPHIALDAAVITGCAASLRENNCKALTMSDIIDSTLLYCDVLRYEFIYHKPCQNINDQIQRCVEQLCQLGALTKTPSAGEENSTDEYELNEKLSDILLSSMAALNITYWTTTECLRDVLETGHMLESEFIKLSLERITEKYNNGTITYGEAISTDSVKNCLKLLQKWGVIEVDAQSGKRIVLLTSMYSTEENVQTIVEKIERVVIMK